MAKKLKNRVLSVMLSIVMLIGIFPMNAFAAIPNWEENNVVYDGKTFGTNGYYNVISKKDWVLVPGAAVESEIVLNNASGTRRQVLHVIEVDPSNPDVSIVPGYNQVDKDITQEEYWSHAPLTDMAEYYEDTLGYNIVGGMNTDLYYDTYAPRIIVYNGKDLSVKGKTSPSSSVLCVFKDAEGNISCDVRAFNRAEFDGYLADGTLLHAVGVSFAMTVKDGELVSKTEERTSAAAARSMVGVKEDGTLVICMNDGRGANNSIGFCNYELGESMLALGCKWAANCDGGGSSTFLTKRVGEEEFTMRSVPCDGAQRPTAHGIFVASNVGPTGELDVINIEAEYDYFVPNIEYTFKSAAIDTHGYAMDMPADAAWALSDASFGTIENGKFVSNGKKGAVDVQVTSGGKVVGTKTITVADPEVFKLSSASTVIPYSTTEKVRTIALPIVATTGEANVYYDANAVEVTLSNDKAGTLNGFNFTATTDTSVSGVTATVKYGEISLEYVISFGKGSEVLWDFENGNLHGFLGQADAYNWQAAQGIASPMKSIIDAGNASFDVHSKSFIATEENGGQVHNGESALGIEFDMRYTNINSWSYANIYNVSNTDGSGVLRDVANGKKATTLGMWVYVPEGFYTAVNAGAMAIRGDFVAGASVEKAVRTNFNATYNGKTINSLKESDIPDNRWIYAVFDLSGYNYVSINNALSTDNYSPCFARMYVKHHLAQKLTYYFDDFTLDYSSAVDDRNPPVISEATYCTADTNIAVAGSTIPSNVASFNAKIADYAAANAEGLDYSSARIYLDGIKLSGIKASGSNLSVEDVKLSAGEHTIKFKIADKLGNESTLTESFKVEASNAKSSIKIKGHNDSGEAAKADSIYYIDVVAEEIEKIDEAVVTIELHTSNTWELEGMTTAPGFEVSYTENPSEKEFVTFTIEKVDDCDLTGEQTILSIPVRLWTWDESWSCDSKGSTMTFEQRYEDSAEPVVSVKADVRYGYIKYTDKSTGSFGGGIDVATEMTGRGVKAFTLHRHDAELTILSKAPTTKEEGYENRTYCETCKSVVDWGTKLEKLNHNYEIVDGQFVCTDEGCGEVYESGTGIFEMNGELYYSINDVLQKGWQTADEGYCYAKPDYTVAVGEEYINGIQYVFDENGILVSGAWVTDENGTKYSYGPKFYSRMWAEIDGKTYYFGRDSYMYTGIRFVKDNPDTPAYWYDFGEDGATDKTVKPEDGIYEVNGDLYIVKDGETQNGVHYIDGYYYFGGLGSGFERIGYIAKNATISVSEANANGLIPSGVYKFDEEGKMIINHGPVGEYFYDENGFMVKAYQLVEFEGNYYYICEYNKYAVNKKVYLTKDILDGTEFKPGYYEFGADGKMVLKNGPQEDGYFYRNGAKQLAYQFVEFEGNYYYICEYNKYAVSKKVYLTKDILDGTEFKPGYYEFGADGKMVLKNGPQEDGYFYRNGAKQLAYQFVEFEGNYYYICEYNKYAVNKKVYLTKDILDGTEFKPGYYEFGADGKMIIE